MYRMLAIFCVLVQSATPLLALCHCDGTGACCAVEIETASGCCSEKPVETPESCCHTPRPSLTPDACDCCTCCEPRDTDVVAITHDRIQTKLRPVVHVGFIETADIAFLPIFGAAPSHIDYALIRNRSHNTRQAWLAVWLN